MFWKRQFNRAVDATCEWVSESNPEVNMELYKECAEDFRASVKSGELDWRPFYENGKFQVDLIDVEISVLYDDREVA